MRLSARSSASVGLGRVDLKRMVHPVEEALERAESLIENGQAARAIQNLELVLFRFPDDPRLIVRLAELYVMEDQGSAAASYYLQALRLDPSDQELQIRMGAVLEAAKPDIEKLAEGSTVQLPAVRRRKMPDVPTVRLDDFDVDEEVLSLVPRDLVVRFRVVPIARSGQTLLLATSQPENRRALEEIAFVTNMTVNCAVATDAEITSALKRFYGLGAKLRAAKKKKR